MQKKKETFLKSVPPYDDISKILFYGNQVSHGDALCIEFHDHPPISKEEKNYKENIRVDT